jgi:8-oxo-dGTP pyrophosphatase MutT (NUDIX family)
MLNGVGGKMEPGELPRDAMAREFLEEAGENTIPESWVKFACLAGPHYRVYCFTIRLSGQFSPRKGNPNGEQARWRSVDPAFEPNWIPNLRWLIPMALLKHKKPEWQETGTVFLT